jgi:hypothetical protein
MNKHYNTVYYYYTGGGLFQIPYMYRPRRFAFNAMVTIQGRSRDELDKYAIDPRVN